MHLRFDPTDAGVAFIANEYVFEVFCQDGNSWPAPGSITWPNCIVEKCVAASIPALTAHNFTVKESKDVKVGEKVQYQCTHANEVREWEE